jgi:hypothetical protein
MFFRSKKHFEKESQPHSQIPLQNLFYLEKILINIF